VPLGAPGGAPRGPVVGAPSSPEEARFNDLWDFWAGLGAVLEPSWGDLAPSCGVLEPPWARLGALLELSWAVLEASRGSLKSSRRDLKTKSSVHKKTLIFMFLIHAYSHLKASLEAFGRLLEASWGILARSWSLWRLVRSSFDDFEASRSHKGRQGSKQRGRSFFGTVARGGGYALKNYGNFCQTT